MELIDSLRNALEYVRKINKFLYKNNGKITDEYQFWNEFSHIYGNFEYYQCPDLDIAYATLAIELDNPGKLSLIIKTYHEEADKFFIWYDAHLDWLKKFEKSEDTESTSENEEDHLNFNPLRQLSVIGDDSKKNEEAYNTFFKEFTYYRNRGELISLKKLRKERSTDKHGLLARLFHKKSKSTPEEQQEIERYMKFKKDYIAFIDYFTPPNAKMKKLMKRWENQEISGKDLKIIQDEDTLDRIQRDKSIQEILEKFYKIVSFLEKATDFESPEEFTEVKRGAPKKKIFDTFEECFQKPEDFKKVSDILDKEKGCDAVRMKGLCDYLIDSQMLHPDMTSIKKLSSLVIKSHAHMLKYRIVGGTVSNARDSDRKYWEKKFNRNDNNVHNVN